jgi:hypothetical protein
MRPAGYGVALVTVADPEPAQPPPFWGDIVDDRSSTIGRVIGGRRVRQPISLPRNLRARYSEEPGVEIL